MENITRRRFIKFIGQGSAGLAISPLLIQACAPGTTDLEELELVGIEPTLRDEVVLADGLKYDLLIKWKDPINDKDFFGYNNDYTAFIPFSDNDGLLWVNHEYVDPKFVSGYFGDLARHRRQVDEEMLHVGGSIVRIKKKSGKWEVVQNDEYNRRITAKTMIPFAWNEPIKGKTEAMGTLANCSGGVTPWGTILTCEENYENFYGDTHENGSHINSLYEWEIFYNNPPEHYGWVVEVNPKTGDAKKLISMGRFAHECATVKELPDGRLVVYSGDDKNDGCLYKFISSEPGNLEKGTLYVASLETNSWIPLDFNSHVRLQGLFESQTDVMVKCRQAAIAMEGSQLDRPEDIEIDPVTGGVFISLTNNIPKENYHGSILKIDETDGNYESLTFEWDTFLTGGEESGFTCPDNLAFDASGNLWFTSDISGKFIGTGPYSSFGNNGLFVVRREGPQAGKVIQVASAPVEAEFTGPTFTPDGKQLILSVQHPGERSKSIYDFDFTSHWPEGGNSVPKSAVIVISGV